jgi:hypothetical protein
MKLLPLTKLSLKQNKSLEVVRVLDQIRYELPDDEEFGEFYWFAREYPRCYRHNLNHAEFRLNEIYKRYQTFHALFAKSLIKKGSDFLGMSISDRNAYELYWDFEAYLSAISSALDILARIIGTAYEEQTPVSFNKICAKTNLVGLVDILRRAKSLWVSRMKDYRDCFMHYTPVDTDLAMSLAKYSDGWEVRAKLPVNPNCRDILCFRYSRRVELLRYAVSLYKHVLALDAAVAKEIRRLYRINKFPKRTQNLFFVGRRAR